MAGFWATAQPYLVGAISTLAPLLTILYARRDRGKDESRTAGQQLVDNIVADNKTLRENLKAAEAECKACHDLLDKYAAEWAAIGTTRTEAYERAKRLYERKHKLS